MRYVAFLFLWPLTACTTTVSVESTPGAAEVAVATSTTSDAKVLGTTPLSLDLATLHKDTGGAPLVLIVRKPGFEPQRFALDSSATRDLDIKVGLATDQAQAHEVNRYIAQVLRGQRMLIQKRYDEALRIAAEIRSTSSNIASAYEIEGAAYFLTNRLREARFAWARVLEIDPNNEEARGMLALVEARLGVAH